MIIQIILKVQLNLIVTQVVRHYLALKYGVIYETLTENNTKHISTFFSGKYEFWSLFFSGQDNYTLHVL